MLNEQTFPLLSATRMNGFARALKEQLTNEDYQQLSFDERGSMLVDREHADREARKLTRRLQHARLRERACLEDLDYRQHRRLDKALVRRLANCEWINKHQNILVTGLFFQLVARRYERTSTLITTNQTVTQWGAVFGGEVLAAAILDRLLHRSHTLMIVGESYRLKQKRKAGFFGGTAATQRP